ncbi:MAG: dipeptidase [Myxococcota bacterium]
MHRSWLAVATLGLACAPPGSPGELSEAAALELHEAAIVVETHADTTPWFEDPDWSFSDRHEDGHIDLPRAREGGLDVVFWSIYMGRQEGDGRAIREAVERIDAVHEMVADNADDVGLAFSVADIRKLVREGKLASLMGVEGGHIIEDNLRVLRTYYRLGVRYLTLTHSFHTAWADSSGTNEMPEPEHHGLTPFGEDVVRELNRLGMMVDVSHVSDETFWDVLRVTSAPVIASHSSCRAVTDHPRNLSDDMLRAVARNGGVVQINFYPGYIDEGVRESSRQLYLQLRPEIKSLRDRHDDDPVLLRRALRDLYRAHPFPRPPLDTLLDHFDHAIRVAGPDHVGIGADWDGVPSMPEGMEDVSHLPALTLGLLRRGHSKEAVLKVLGGNLLRVLERVEGVARRTRRLRSPG